MVGSPPLTGEGGEPQRDGRGLTTGRDFSPGEFRDYNHYEHH